MAGRLLSIIVNRRFYPYLDHAMSSLINVIVVMRKSYCMTTNE